jgi:hypothetical protein
MKYILLYTNIKAYQYEADIHCIDCTHKRFAYKHDDGCIYLDDDQLDNEGNEVHPVFDTDEWYDYGDTENPIQHMVCGDCHKIIETYEVMEVAND